MQNPQKPSQVSKVINLDDSRTETATTKFVIVVTILGIIFFIVLYLIIILKTNTNSHGVEIGNNLSQNITNSSINLSEINKTETEDLTIAESLVSHMGKYPPRPFINHFRGPTPASFHPTRPKSVSYAQLQNYNQGSGSLRNPHNIQDVIGFLMPGDEKKKSNGLKAFWGPNTHDPFYSYKPKDPSDINLLATANLRFAPPIWKEISNPAPTSAPSYQPHETSNHEQHASRNSRALTLTLNLFPMANDPRQEHYYAVSSNMMPNAHRKMQPRKMIIHLNIYPNNGILNRDEDVDEDYFMERNIIERSMNGLQQVLNKNEKLVK